MTTFPDSVLLPQGATDLLDGTEPNLWYTSPDGQSRFYLDGPMAPWPGIQDGIILAEGIKGLTPPFKHIDLKPARQHGVIWTGTVFDPLEVDLQLQVHADTPQGLSKVWSEWVGAWDPFQRGVFESWTTDRGYWYFPARLNKPWPDQDKKSARRILVRNITHSMRCDLAFWLGMPYISTFQSASGSTFLPLLNTGDQPAWPQLICYGPGTFSFTNGPTTTATTTISFGPLETGQVALLTTYPPIRNVVDLTNGPATELTYPEKLLATLVNFVTNGNVPPLIQWFESLFGVLPTQAPLYSLLNGRYTNPIPGVAQPQWAQMNYLKVSISGGHTGTSKIIGRIDPMRRSPE